MAVTPSSADLWYSPTVLAKYTMKRKSQSEENPLSPTSSNTYYIIQGIGVCFVLFWFVSLFVFKVGKLGDRGQTATGQKHGLSAGLEDFCVEIWAGSNVFWNRNSSAGFLFSCYPGVP